MVSVRRVLDNQITCRHVGEIWSWSLLGAVEGLNSINSEQRHSVMFRVPFENPRYYCGVCEFGRSRQKNSSIPQIGRYSWCDGLENLTRTHVFSTNNMLRRNRKDWHINLSAMLEYIPCLHEARQQIQFCFRLRHRPRLCPLSFANETY